MVAISAQKDNEPPFKEMLKVADLGCMISHLSQEAVDNRHVADLFQLVDMYPWS